MNTIEDMLDKALEHHDQVILTGAPGTGKTYSVKKYVGGKEYVFVQFHPSYDYSDFVEGLKPVLLNSTSNDPTFVKLDGKFKEFCRKVVIKNYNNPKYTPYEAFSEKFDKDKYLEKENELKEDNFYYFIIDEINRADLSKVFGELMLILEKRGINTKVKTQYSTIDTYYIKDDGTATLLADDCFKDGFFIPKNIKIIGTMNDIDRNVESFDFALRRRFEWINVKVDDIYIQSLEDITKIYSKKTNNKNYNTNLDDLKNKLDKLNKLIINNGCNFGLNEDYCIGPAYFKNLDISNDDYDENLYNIYIQNIEPLLKEYTRGRNNENFLKDCENIFEY